ncbi:hypothetical protein OQA88_11339 [Cercophora sp. LCS_1]
MNSRIATLTSSKQKKSPFVGTGPGGATIAAGQFSNLGVPEGAKVTGQTQKLHVQGDSIKCNIANGPVIVRKEVRFVGKTKTYSEPPRVVAVSLEKGPDATVTIAGSMRMTVVCESLETEGLLFGDEDDDI